MQIDTTMMTPIDVRYLNQAPSVLSSVLTVGSSMIRHIVGSSVVASEAVTSVAVLATAFYAGGRAISIHAKNPSHARNLFKLAGCGLILGAGFALHAACTLYQKVTSITHAENRFEWNSAKIGYNYTVYYNEFGDEVPPPYFHWAIDCYENSQTRLACFQNGTCNNDL